MVKRHARSSFGSAHAFPGGVLEDSDRNVHEQCFGRTGAEADALLSVDHDSGLDYFSAAVRELFEEAGVLLGRSRLPVQGLDAVRSRLNDASLSWDSFVTDYQLEMHCEQLHYFSFWITPEMRAKRYSTRFFLAELPEGQNASHDGGELTDSCWMPVREILTASKNKTMRVHYPTRKTLESLAPFASTAALCSWAKTRAEAGVPCTQPVDVPESER